MHNNNPVVISEATTTEAIAALVKLLLEYVSEADNKEGEAA